MKWAIFILAIALSGCVGSPDLAPETEELAQPELFASWSPVEPTIREAVQFSFTSNKDVIAAMWNFGDGTSAGQLAPSHAYHSTGLKEVRVQIQFPEGIAETTIFVPVLDENGNLPSTLNDEEKPIDDAKPVGPITIHTKVTDNQVQFSYAWDRTPTGIQWDFGDGTGSSDESPKHEYLRVGLFEITIQLASGTETQSATAQVEVTTVGYEPHVIVAIPDSGINPYHELYYRPERTEHPCTYVLNFPCDIAELPLSIGKYDTYAEAWAADEEIFRGMTKGEWFWIPQTVFISVMCEGSTNASGQVDEAAGDEDVCLIDDTSMHGTGTTSSVIMENPDALLIFKEGNSGTGVFEDASLQIDIVSYSWGAAAPLVLGPLFYENWAPFFVAASGNEGAFPVVLDATKAHPSIINVGAGDSETQTEPGYSGWKTMDFVSEYCRPTAQTQSITEIRDRYCGTSFSAPTFAGALSAVLLDLRRESGYLGSMENGTVDPILGIDKWEIRDALNATATYEPEDAYDQGGDTVPLVAPWYQWGWGYFAKEQVPATLVCIRDGECPTRPDETVAYMDALWTYRTTTTL